MRRLFPLIAFFFLCVSSCTPHYQLKSLREEIRHIQSKRLSITLPDGYHDYRGAIHVHSFLSHDSQGTYEEILYAARAAGVSFLMMTDHDSPRIFQEGLRGMHDGILVIQGMEISKGCGSRPCASLLALGLSSYFDHQSFTLKETIEEIERQGALAFIAHPTGWHESELESLTGMEIYDILDDALDKKWQFPKLFFDLLYSHKKYPEEVFLSIQDYPRSHLALWDRLQKIKKIVGIAGNDAHQNVNILGRQVDPYVMSFRFVSTHLLARELTEASVLAALKEGHAYVAFDLLADPTGFFFTASSHGKETVMGELSKFTPGQTITVQSPLEGIIVLLKDGKQIAQCRCASLTYPIEGPGVYRAEVFLKIQHRLRPWIFSNPIYIR